VQSALTCHDYFPHLPSRAEFARIENRLRAIAPQFGWLEGRYELGRCWGMPPGPTWAPHPLHVPGIAPVLVGIGELDNNTDNLGAAHVAAQLPESRQLWHGDGHAALLMGNTCLAKYATAYLADGTMPPPGTRCPGELLAKIPDRPGA